MQYLFIFMILLSTTAPSFAMERGGGGRDYNRGEQHRDRDFRHDNQNWHHNEGWGGNVYINPQGYEPLYNNNAFPDDAEEDQIYEENLRN